jgi:uncharacterized membrane protein
MATAKTDKYPQTTISGSYGYGWQQLWRYFLYFFIVALIVAFAHGIVSGAPKTVDDEPIVGGIQLVSIALSLLVMPVIQYGADWLYLKGIRNEKMEKKLLIEGFSTNYLQIILANLITFALIGIGFVFLIIPGIIIACRLVFVPYIVMDKRLEPLAALEKSWDMTRGYGWTIFGMAMLAILVFIAGLLCFLVGAFISGMWISASFASLYHAIDWEQQEKIFNSEQPGAATAS